MPSGTLNPDASLIQEIEADFERERPDDGDLIAWYISLNEELVDTLVLGGVYRAEAELAVWDFLSSAEDANLALEGLVILLRSAVGTGRLGEVVREFAPPHHAGRN